MAKYDDVLKSVKGLVAYNGGFFKSEKQAAFLLSQTTNGAFIESGSIYRNNFSIWYYADEKGIYKVVKYVTKGKDTGAKWIFIGRPSTAKRGYSMDEIRNMHGSQKVDASQFARLSMA